MRELLEATERAGFAAATGLLNLWGLGWLPGKAAPKYPPPLDTGQREAERAALMQSISDRLQRRGQVELWRAGRTFDYPEDTGERLTWSGPLPVGDLAASPLHLAALQRRSGVC